MFMFPSVASTQLPPFPLGPWAILGPCDGAPVQLAAGGSLHDLLHVKRVMLQEANGSGPRVGSRGWSIDGPGD